MEKIISPRFNVLDKYKNMYIINPYRFAVDSTLLTDLEAYYKMDETSGTISYDSTSNDIDGTIDGATVNQTGIINKCYSFNGIANDPDDVTFPSGVLPVFTSFSFSCWIYANSTQTNYAYILDFRDNQEILLSYTTSSNTIRFAVDYDYIITASVLSNTWVHIIGTWDGTTTKLYINGVLEDSVLCNVSSSLNGIMCFGRSYNNTDIYLYNGKLDEIGIWSRALTSSEIAELYNSGTGKTHPFS